MPGRAAPRSAGLWGDGSVCSTYVWAKTDVSGERQGLCSGSAGSGASDVPERLRAARTRAAELAGQLEAILHVRSGHPDVPSSAALRSYLHSAG